MSCHSIGFRRDRWVARNRLRSVRNPILQALAQLRQEQAEAHRRFIRRLDHEVKNPLTAIRAGLTNLPDQAGSPALASVRAQAGAVKKRSGACPNDRDRV